MFDVKKRSFEMKISDLEQIKCNVSVGQYGQGSGTLDFKGIMASSTTNWNISEGDTLMITRFNKDNLTGEDEGVQHLDLHYPEWKAILLSFSPDYLRKLADEIEQD